MVKYMGARAVKFKGFVRHANQDTITQANVDIRADLIHKGIDPIQIIV